MDWGSGIRMRLKLTLSIGHAADTDEVKVEVGGADYAGNASVGMLLQRTAGPARLSVHPVWLLKMYAH